MRETRNASRVKDAEEIDYKELVFQRQIGEGEYGKIYKGQLWGQTVALKVMKEKVIKNAEALADFAQEMKVMKELRHPNIVEYMGVCLQKPKLCIITEYLPNGCLEKYMTKKAIKSTVPLETVLGFALDIARGLNWMHHRGYIHRDVKPANLLVSNSETVKLADFGLCIMLDQADQTDFMQVEAYLGQAGTMWYMSPEVLMNEKYGVKCDTYSFAVVVCELLNSTCFRSYGTEPKGRVREDAFARAVWDGLRPVLPKSAPTVLTKLITSCWAHEPSSRPSLDDVIVLLEQMLKNVKAGGDGELDVPRSMQHVLTGKCLRSRKNRKTQKKEQDHKTDDDTTDEAEAKISEEDESSTEGEEEETEPDIEPDMDKASLQKTLATTKKQLEKERKLNQKLRKKVDSAKLEKISAQDDTKLETLRQETEIRALRKQLAEALQFQPKPDKENKKDKENQDKSNKDKNKKEEKYDNHDDGKTRNKRGLSALQNLNVNEFEGGRRIRQCKIETIWKMSRM